MGVFWVGVEVVGEYCTCLSDDGYWVGFLPVCFSHEGDFIGCLGDIDTK